jgi:hypothetical protein
MEDGSVWELVSEKGLEAQYDLEEVGETFDSKGGQTKVLIVVFICAEMISCLLAALP